jgi:hypothetical protein
MPIPLLRLIVIAAAFALAGAAGAQDAPAPAAAQPASASETVQHPRAPYGFLIHGTVFDDKALSVPGAELRIRRSGEKKYHWNATTNSRGEFAIRVPPGNEYEVLVKVRGFADAVHPVDAKNGLGDETVVVRLEIAGKKK